MKHTLVPLAVALAVLLPIFPAAGQVPDRLKYFIPAPPAGLQEAASFGWRVAQDARYTVVGAPFDDIGGGDSGVVKVFDSTTGALLFLLTNPGPATPDMSDNFGFAVAISGTRLVVAAYHEDMGSTDSGSAYVYDLSSSTPTVPVVTLHNPSPTLNDQFGYSVAISGDTVAVGAVNESSKATGVNGDQADNSALKSGAAYLFVRRGTTWSQQAYLKASNTGTHDRFGRLVAVSGDTVVVGISRLPGTTAGVNSTPDENASISGAAYIFKVGNRANGERRP